MAEERWELWELFEKMSPECKEIVRKAILEAKKTCDVSYAADHILRVACRKGAHEVRNVLMISLEKPSK